MAHLSKEWEIVRFDADILANICTVTAHLGIVLDFIFEDGHADFSFEASQCPLDWIDLFCAILWLGVFREPNYLSFIPCSNKEVRLHTPGHRVI